MLQLDIEIILERHEFIIVTDPETRNLKTGLVLYRDSAYIDMVFPDEDRTFMLDRLRYSAPKYKEKVECIRGLKTKAFVELL